MASITISDLHPDELEHQLTALADDEKVIIQGGWAGVAIGAAALGLAAYVAFTTEKDRVHHRDVAYDVIHKQKGHAWSFL